MHRVTRRRLAGLLALVCIAEISVSVASWRDRAVGEGAPAARAAGPISAKTPAATGLETVPLATFSAFVDRPLFLASRRPPPAAGGISSTGAVSISAKGVIFGPYKFTGIVVTPTVRIAFVTEMKTGKSITLAVGGKLGDWICAEIKPGRVILEQDGRREVIELHPTR